jgi:phosphotransferase system enzyme I (PtsI)
MHPAHLLTVKQQVLRTDLEEVTAVANKMLRTEDPERLHGLLDRMNA